MVGKAMKRYWVFFFWVVWVAAVSCTPVTPPTPAPIEPITTARVTATTVFDPTVTMEATGTAVRTHTPITISTPAATDTPTAVPTLSPDEALAAVTKLYETNGGCLLPCWWGFAPGQTDWIAAKEFLTPIADAIYEGIDPVTPPWSVEIHLPNTFYKNRVMIHNYLIEEDIIQAFEVKVSEPSALFAPASILNTYGMPEEIYLRSWQGGTYILVTFFYPQYSFRLTYSLDAEINENGFIGTCFQEEFPWLTIWSPEQDLTFTETYALFHREDNGDYQIPLEVAAGMNVATFYETFSDPDVPICLETPTDIWPGY